MTLLKRFSQRLPVLFSIAVIALVAVLTELPLKPFFERFMDVRKAHFVNVALLQSVCTVVLVLLIRALGVTGTAGFTRPREWKKVWLGWPLVLMGLLNATDYIGGPWPFNTTDPLDYILFVLVVVSVGLVEEIMARSLVLNVMLRKWGSTRKGILLSVFASSALFGLSHLLTVITGMRDLTAGLIQVFTTTFFGVIFAALYLRNNSVWPIIILHAFVDLIATSHDLTARFGEVHTANLAGALVSLAISALLLGYSLLILRKVKPGESPQVGISMPGISA